jgi:TPR repeat protein
MHALGEGVEADLAEAARWFERAARAGDARAQMTLGVMHYHGEGVARDRVNAFAWLSLAGAAGRDEALVYLELVRDELQPDELDRADRLARALFREHGDPELKRMMEGGWLARRAATPAR